MPSTFSTSLRLELIGDGEQSGVWGQTTNNNLGELLEQAITGRTTLDVTSGDITLTSLNGIVDQARSAVLAVTGTPGVTRVLTIPNVRKTYTVINSTTNIVQVKTLSGTAFNCPPLSQSYLTCDAVNNIVGRSITDGANTINSLAAPFASPAFTGVPTAPTAAAGTNTTQLATTAFTTAAVAASFPVGGIILWSGSIVSIPIGWALCNGTSGTPDLRDRFVVGAGSTYAVGATGGANTVTLDTTQIPSHTHTGSGTTSATDLSHTHTGSGTTGNNNVGHTHTGSGTTGNNNVDHTHAGTTNNTDLTHNHTGSGTTSVVSNDHAHGFSGSTSSAGTHQHTFPISDTVGIFSIPATGDQFGFFSGTTDAAGAHTHTFSGTTIGQNANHTHTYDFTTTTASQNHAHSFTTGGQSANHVHTYSFTTSGQSADHNHAFSFTTSGASVVMNHNHSFSFTTAATGGGLAHENRPPYFALAYIMRVA
jgi:microcystin-dependent protein